MRHIRAPHVGASLVLAIMLGWSLAFANGIDEQGFYIVRDPRGENGQFGGRLYAGQVTGRSPDGQRLDILCVSRGNLGVTYNRDADGAFAPWARRHSDEIMRILFPNDIQGGMEGTPGGITQAIEAFDEALDTSLPPAAQGRFGLELPSRNQTAVAGEFERFRFNGLDGSVYKLTPGHDVRFERFELGFWVPLRYSELEDDNDSRSYSAGLHAHLKYHYYLYPEWQLIPVVGGGARVFALRSNQSGTFGDVRYGGHFGLTTVVELDRVVVGGGILYSISDSDIPGTLTPDDIGGGLVNSLNGRVADQQITFGTKIAYQLPGRFLATVFGRYIQTVGASDIDPDQQAVSLFGASVLYFPNDWVGAEVGFKQLFATAGLRSSAAFVQGVLYF